MRRQFTSSIMVGLAILVAGLAPPSPVQAADPAVCAVYAASAVNQQKKNKNLGCGFAGGRWSNNGAGHYAWCLGAPNWAVQAETNARANMLANCPGGGPQTKKFVNPKYNGLRLDWCYSWGAQCGAYAAKFFCKTKGYPLLKAWGKAENIGKTRVISTNQVCNDPGCDGFTSITCGK